MMPSAVSTGSSSDRDQQSAKRTNAYLAALFLGQWPWRPWEQGAHPRVPQLPTFTCAPTPRPFSLAAPRGALSYTQLSWEEFEGRFLGLMTDLEPKGEGDSSMSGKQRTPRRRRGWAAAGPVR